MKIRIFIIAVVILSSYALCNKSTKNENKKIDIVGEAFNTDLNAPVVAVSYGTGSNGGYNLKEGVKYINPEMVMKIDENVRPPLPGPLEAVNEVI
jgi:hypothetical protein